MYIGSRCKRVRVAKLLLVGDSVTGVSVTCSKPRNSIGYFTVSVTFSNGSSQPQPRCVHTKELGIALPWTYTSKNL
jgi:hypothetical protein